MPRTTYTPQQRDHALALYAKHGVAETARRTGINRGTIKSWASRAGLQPVQQENARIQMALAHERRQQTIEEFRTEMVARLEAIADAASAETLRLIGEGKLRGYTLVEAWKTAVSQVQLLTGGATERTEVSNVDGEIERLLARLPENDPQPEPVDA